MTNFMLVMVGGGLGAMLREFFMLMVPNLADGFPLDILVVNLLASFLLGLVTGLHRRQVLSDNVSMLVGSTGIIGGMSTFSSLTYGSVVLLSASKASAAVASFYVVTSLVLGYLAVIGGMKLGREVKASLPLAWFTKIYQALPRSARARLVFRAYEEKRTQ